MRGANHLVLLHELQVLQRFRWLVDALLFLAFQGSILRLRRSHALLLLLHLPVLLLVVLILLTFLESLEFLELFEMLPAHF